MGHRYPRRIRTTKSREAIGAKGQLTSLAATATTAANGGGKKKKPAACCPAKYTNDQWKQHYKGKRCVLMKDEELTQEVLVVQSGLQGVQKCLKIRH